MSNTAADTITIPNIPTIEELKEKRFKLREEYNGIMAGVIKGDENFVGYQIRQLDSEIESMSKQITITVPGSHG